jgi:hypothetical protein
MENDKQVILYIFVIAVLNGFYYVVIGNYGALLYFILSLAVGYFVIFPKSFFRALDIARNKAGALHCGMVSSVPHHNSPPEPTATNTESQSQSQEKEIKQNSTNKEYIL